MLPFWREYVIRLVELGLQLWFIVMFIRLLIQRKRLRDSKATYIPYGLAFLFSFIMMGASEFIGLPIKTLIYLGYGFNFNALVFSYFVFKNMVGVLGDFKPGAYLMKFLKYLFLILSILTAISFLFKSLVMLLTV